jgi:lysosome membrane protein 2
MTFDGWHKASIPIYAKFYMFNITNPEEVLALSHKPIVEELGILFSIFGPTLSLLS